MSGIEKSCYPLCYNGSHIGYPNRILIGKGVRFGARAGELVTLIQTPQSRAIPSGEIAQNQKPKRNEVVYTDNGLDSGWTLRVKFWTFSNLVEVDGNVFWHLQVVNNCQIDIDDDQNPKYFQNGYLVRTDVLADVDPIEYDGNNRPHFISESGGSVSAGSQQRNYSYGCFGVIDMNGTGRATFTGNSMVCTG